MSYEGLNTTNIVQEMLINFPELNQPIEAYKKHDDILLLHNVFAFVFNPFLKESLSQKNGKKLKTIFHFFEEMAGSSEHSIKNILGVTVIESLSAAELAISERYMGARTKKVCREIESYLEELF